MREHSAGAARVCPSRTARLRQALWQTHPHVGDPKKTWLLAILTGVACVVVADSLVLQRSPDLSGGFFGLSPDTREYAAMIRGEPAAGPFAHRLLVPLVARSLPLAPLPALALITRVSLALALAVNFSTLLACGVRKSAALLAVLGFAGTVRGLVLVQNLYLVDAASLLAGSLMLQACVVRRADRFGVASVVGTLVREDALFTAPTWLMAGSRRRGALILLAAVAACVAPRLWGPPTPISVPEDLFRWGTVIKAYFAFGWLWPAALLGLVALRVQRRAVWAFAALAGAGSLLSCLLAVDTLRVFLPLAPVCMLGVGLLVDSVREARWLWVTWWLALLVAPLVALPNLLLGAPADLADLEQWYAAQWPLIVAGHAVGWTLVAATARKLQVR